MSQGLSYRTAVETSPRSLPGIYFCCHPADRDACLEPVVRDILEIRPDTAVWVREDGSEEDPAEELDGMDLFVIPVTRRFLEDDSPARCRELPLALDRHIPVLPLLWEEGLERLFDEVCGELHTLSPHAGSVAYRQKLRQVLDQTLLDEDLRHQIRNSFDTHIFLSYRKKDHALAALLPSLIHEDPLLENTAVWFDDYLFPGEYFDEALADMIRHSSVFLLLTTPALSEAPNYVLDHEYPLAAELGLPVLAVTAGGAASCPLAADAVCPLDDPQALRDLLRQLLRRTALSHAAAPDGYPLLSRRMTALMGGSAGAGLLDTLLDPFQYYWLGLAYLNGIDVETDRARALRFLMLSAESGHPEAARKLSACYAAGIGTAPDAAAAARWQEYYLDSLEEEGTEGTKDTDDGSLLARYMEWNSLFLYRAAAGETGWLPEAQEKLHALMQSLEQRGCLPPAAAAEDLCREGILLALREDRDGAEIRYREALRQLEELRGRIEPSYHDLIAAQIRFLQADSAGDCGRTEEAILRYQQSLDELRHDAGDATAFWRMYCGMRLGELLLQTPRMAEALPVLQAALASADRLLSSPDMAPAPQDLVRLHKDLGLLLSPSDPEGARAHFLEARQTAQKLLGGGQPDAGLFRDSCWILYFMGTLSSFTPAEREAYLLECQERANDLPDKEKAALLTAASLALKRLKLAGTGRKIRDRLKNLFRPR